jgi:hypothetical protein
MELKNVAFGKLKRRKRRDKMVDIKVYRLGNVFLEVGDGELEITVVENFYDESGERIRRQVAKGNIATALLDFWQCIRDVAEQKKETEGIARSIDVMIENAEKERAVQEKMRRDAEAL